MIWDSVKSCAIGCMIAELSGLSLSWPRSLSQLVSLRKPDPGGLANRHRRAARGTIERRSGYSPDNTGNNHENCNPFIGNGACARQHGGTRASPGIGRLRNRYRSFRRLIHRSGRYDQRAAHLEQHRSPGARAQAIATNGSTQPAIHGWRVAGSRNALT